MNFDNILKAIQKGDTGAFEEVSGRRDVLKGLGSKVAVAALPLAVASLFGNKAKAQTLDEIFDAMNLVLKYEYLLYAFYNKVLNSSGIVFATLNGKAAFETIRDQKNAHISYLQWLINNQGGTALSSPLLDLTGGQGSGMGPFAELLTDYRRMLSMAQTLEDTAVRVHKGQMTLIMANDSLLIGVASVHSAAARYAAHIRLMRAEAGNATVKPWVTGSDSNTDNSYLQAFYNSGGETTQLGINLLGINGQAITANAATEAFDEPIGKDQAVTLLDPFIIP